MQRFHEKTGLKESARKFKISHFGQEIQAITLRLCHDNAAYFGQIGNI